MKYYYTLYLRALVILLTRNDAQLGLRATAEEHWNRREKSNINCGAYIIDGSGLPG